MKVKKNILEADSVVDQAADAVDAEAEVTVPNTPKKKDLGMIFNVLNKSLATAKRKMLVAEKGGRDKDGHFIKRPENFPNVLFIGGAGIGKTSQIKRWAEKNGVNLFILQGSTLDAADLGGLPMIDRGDGTKAIRAQKVGTGILDQLDRPNSVLFLDELNRARPDVRAALLQLINDHIVQDFEANGGMRFFDNFLFTVAAINPAGKAGYQTFELDQAEKGRFRNKYVKADNASWLDFAYEHYMEEAQQLAEDEPKLAAESVGRAEIARSIAGNANFSFDDDSDLEEYEEDEDWNGLATTPRNLTLLLDNSDGTKADVIDLWSDYCNNKHEHLIKNILKNYRDKDDKANSVFKQGTQSSLLNRQKSGFDSLKNKYGN